MQEKLLFEYAIIRVMPRVERGEFINVGVIVYCSSKRFLQIKFEVNAAKLQALYDGVNIAEVTERLHAFEHVCSGLAHGGPIAQLPIASRFRWLIAARSTVVQVSPVHPGLCQEPGQALLKIYNQMVE